MSNQKNNLSKRLTRPQTLGSAFGNLLKIFGARASDADLAERWDEIVGPQIGSMAKLVGVRKTKDKKINLSVMAINPSFALQLTYQIENIRNSVDKYYGYNVVNKITIKKF
jgi:hypothetical protein